MRFSIFVIVVMVSIFLFVGILISGIYHIYFYSDRAKIEQLRADLQKVDDISSEDVIGQVTMWNQTIRSMQAYNNIPIFCIGVPNGWDDIELLELERN